MKLHRFIGEYNLSGNELKIVDLAIIKQIKTVLKLKIGEKVIISDGKGIEAGVSIFSISKKEITCKIEKIVQKKDIEKTVNLYLAILKKENFELAVQKAVECGVSKITPIITERTIKTGINEKRLQKIIIEASEQCGQNIVPTLSSTLYFKDALVVGAGAEEKNIFHLDTIPYSPNKKNKIASIFVGPEGGFTKKEIELAKNFGYTVASLGSLILRGETAATVATYRAVNSI